MGNAVFDKLIARSNKAKSLVPVMEVRLRVQDDLAVKGLQEVVNQPGGMTLMAMCACRDDSAEAEDTFAIVEASGIRDHRNVASGDPDRARVRLVIAAVKLLVWALLLDDKHITTQANDVVQLNGAKFIELTVGNHRWFRLGHSHGPDFTLGACRSMRVAPNQRGVHMPLIDAGDRSLYAESFGDPADPALLLIAGLTSQLTSWPEPFCQALVDRGFFVLRFDNRDVGLSTKYMDRDPYTLSDMANDCVEVLQYFETGPAHVLGLSMGGMVAQTLAIDHPEMMLSMISYASRTGHPDIGNPTDEAIEALFKPPPTTRAEAEAAGVYGKRVWGTPDTWDEGEWATFSGDNFDRSNPEGSGLRQYAAIEASGNRDTQLAQIDVPTLVIHGSIDPLITPEGGRHTAEIIPGATYEEIEGMGHDLPITEWPHIVALVTAHAVAATNSERGQALFGAS